MLAVMAIFVVLAMYACWQLHLIYTRIVLPSGSSQVWVRKDVIHAAFSAYQDSVLRFPGRCKSLRDGTTQSLRDAELDETMALYFLQISLAERALSAGNGCPSVSTLAERTAREILSGIWRSSQGDSFRIRIRDEGLADRLVEMVQEMMALEVSHDDILGSTSDA